MRSPSPRVIGAVSRALNAWIAEGQPYSHDARVLLRQYAWSRNFFGINLALQRKLNPPRPLSAPPLFILGLWRSGTTYLHELLAASPALCTPRTWQCMAPSTFAITARPRSSIAVKRPMDDFTISAESPQEDEFALLMLGAPSVYRGFIDPRRLGELQSMLDPDGMEAATPIDTDWLTFLQTVNTLEGPTRRLLLKSPNHTFRLPALCEGFPDAPLVWIARDPKAVLHSNLKMWQRMTSLYGLAPAPDGEIERFVLRAIDCAAQALDKLVATTPRQRLVVIALDELRAAPVTSALSVFEQLGLPHGEEVSAAVSAVAQRHAQLRAEDYASHAMHEGAAPVLARLDAAQRAASASHGLLA
jgi:hypothetical protein